MSYTVTKIDKVYFSNIDKDTRYVPLDSYTFNVPVSKGKVDSIGLFFSTTGDIVGELQVDLYINRVHRKYTVASNQVVKNSPILLTIDHTFTSDSMVNIALQFKKESGDGTFNMRITNSGPCLYVEGERVDVLEFPNPPLISIITPVYKTDIEYLKKTVESVASQTYEKWEWCIVDDGSGDEALKEYLGSLKDPRIKVSFREKNGGIVAASNDALALATGKFVGFLDHDDLLDKDALLEVARVLWSNPETDLVYTDEDKVLDNGSFVGTFYKPDFNYSLFLSSNYLCHFSVYRKSILDELNGIRMGFDGSQDYDLALRFIEKTKNIKHIPKILYHWRVTSNSTSSSILHKPEARINGARALEDHLKRIKRMGRVIAGNFPGQYNVRYTLPVKPMVSIIIPFKDKVSLLNNLLKTFSLTDYQNYEILLVDNGSVEKQTKEFLSSLSTNKKIRVLRYPGEFNFSKINNYAVSLSDSRSEFVLFLNNDIEIMHPEWLYNMVQHFIRPEVGAVGAKLLYLDHKIQHAGVFVGINGLAGHGHKKIWDWEPGYFCRPHLTQDITAVTGACMMVRKKAFLDIGCFDEELPEAFNDVDLCLALRKNNWSIVYTPYAKLYHLESFTRGFDTTSKKFIDSVKYMYNKWNLSHYTDPFYNINLPDNCEGRSWL